VRQILPHYVKIATKLALICTNNFQHFVSLFTHYSFCACFKIKPHHRIIG